MADNDEHAAIHEILDTPRPAMPGRAEFATEELFEDAWSSWQTETLERAELALQQVRTVIDSGTGAGMWVPRDLVAVAMLRAEVARERSLAPEHRFFDTVELDRVGGMLDRLDPEITAGSPDGQTGQFWGPASNAHQYLPAGMYDAVEVATGDPVRLVVGAVAGRVSGQGSAAFPLRPGAEQSLDEIAVVLSASEAAPAVEALDRVRTLVAETGRAVTAAEAPGVDIGQETLARLAATLGMRASRLARPEVPDREAPAVPGLALGQ
jgi:hypothetical protein